MLEIITILAEHHKFFIYGIICGFIIDYFEKTRISISSLIRILIYGIITEFSFLIVVGFEVVDITNESQVIVAVIGTSTFIQLFLIPLILDEESRNAFKKWIYNKFKV